MKAYGTNHNAPVRDNKIFTVPISGVKVSGVW